MHRRHFAKTLFAVPLASRLLYGHAAETSQSYPSRPIRMVVPFPAGGSFDAIVRAGAERLSANTRQPVVVENKAGAGGMIGAMAVAKAPGDGYTLLFSTSALTQNPHLYAKMPYEPTELTPVIGVISIPLAFTVRTGLGIKTMREFVARSRAEPGKFSYGSISTASQVLGELLGQASGMNAVRVPYRGEQPALTDLIGGALSASFLSPGVAARYPDKLRVLAVSGEERIPGIEAPTFVELGFSDLKISGWGGVFAPATTPPEIIEKLAMEFAKVGAMKDFVDRSLAFGFPPTIRGTADFARFVTSDSEFWARTVKQFQLKGE